MHPVACKTRDGRIVGLASFNFMSPVVSFYKNSKGKWKCVTSRGLPFDFEEAKDQVTATQLAVDLVEDEIAKANGQ